MQPEQQVLPRLKHTSPLYRRDDVLFVGGFGEVTEVEDPSGAIETLLRLADGTRDAAAIHRDLLATHPEVTADEVAEAVEAFDEAGFLENAAATPDGLLTDHEVRRWERNVNFFGSYARLGDNKYELQRRLKDCRVTLLGLGGLGSHILLDAAAMGIGHVRVVEFDTVELSNLNRQILYTEHDIGRPKLDVGVERVRAFNPYMDIEPVPGRITCTDDVLRVARDADAVISVADRPKMEIMQWVNEGCVRAGVPLITGGLETQRAVYYSVLPGRTGCVECWRVDVAESDPVSTALLEERRERRIGGDNAAFGPLVTMVAGMLLAELVRIVTGIAPPAAAGRLMQLHFDDFTFSEAERWSRRPDCAVCGTAGIVERPAAMAEQFTPASAPLAR